MPWLPAPANVISVPIHNSELFWNVVMLERLYLGQTPPSKAQRHVAEEQEGAVGS